MFSFYSSITLLSGSWVHVILVTLCSSWVVSLGSECLTSVTQGLCFCAPVVLPGLQVGLGVFFSFVQVRRQALWGLIWLWLVNASESQTLVEMFGWCGVHCLMRLFWVRSWVLYEVWLLGSIVSSREGWCFYSVVYLVLLPTRSCTEGNVGAGSHQVNSWKH